MTSVTDVPTFELPPIYRKEIREESSDLSSNAENRNQHEALQKTNSQNITRPNLPANPNISSPPQEESMETTQEDERLKKNGSTLPLKPKHLKPKDPPSASPQKEKPLKDIISHQQSTQEKEIETRTEALTKGNSSTNLNYYQNIYAA